MINNTGYEVLIVVDKNLLGYSAVQSICETMFHLNLQDQKSTKQETHAGGGNTFLQTIGSHTDYMTPYPKI
jgi:hypothetical protein